MINEKYSHLKVVEKDNNSLSGEEPPVNNLDRRLTIVETHIGHIREDVRDIKDYMKYGLGILIVSILIPIALHFVP